MRDQQRYSEGSNMKIAYLALAAFIPLFCNAESQKSGVSECVGNLNITFPGEVEIAANSADMLIQEHEIGSIQPKFEFSDGEGAGWSSISYNGQLLISHFLNTEQQKKLLSLQDLSKLNVKKNAAKKKKNKKAILFEELSLSPAEGVAFRIGNGFSASIFSGGHMLWADSTIDEDEIGKYKEEVLEYPKNISFRELGTVPNSTGLCFPYFFLKTEPNGDTHRRYIAVTYRLKKHPDVTVWIEDSYVKNNDDKADSLRNVINEFWSQYQSTSTVDKVESQWKFPSGRKVAIGKNEGLASFVRITRKSGVIDYGYMATVRGDVRKVKNSSDVKVYVLRKAENSTRKGIAPVTAEEFIKLSQEIVSSINIRWDN